MISFFHGEFDTPVFALIASFIGLIAVVLLAFRISNKNPGTDKMQAISKAVHIGAMAFLKREYQYILYFVIGIACVLLFTLSWKTAVAFILGAACSLCAGWIGMKIATKANTRTAEGARKSIYEGLLIALSGGAVMGISVVSLGLLGLTVLFMLYVIFSQSIILADRIVEAISVIVGFSMGASSVALFARVGGGIYTKAADVGADLVGKVEAGIPEDDPRNPAVIADNVGDNVGDVAGMGADLFESYVGTIISGLVLATSSLVIDTKAAMLMLLLAGWGIISSVISILFILIKTKADPQLVLRRVFISNAVVFVLGAFWLTTVWYGSGLFFLAVFCGLLSGLIIGFVAEYYTSGKRVEKIAYSYQTGPATGIIQGLAIGMKSAVIPLIVISITVIVSYQCAGIFGIALAAMGMLAITGMTVAIDAYGPIVDNAAGIAEMAGLGEETRMRAERLDAVGNTTAAIGKGFAVSSAALTALALFTAYTQTVGMNIIDLLDSRVIAGALAGGIVPFLFSAITMQAVGKTAHRLVEEVRRQFREITGIMEGTVEPDTGKCVDIVTKASLNQMILPGGIALVMPIVIGIIFGKEALAGFLAGSVITGVPFALFLANAGGAFDNAKKHIEEGNFGGKGSDTHKAAVIGDTIGDPLKDTSGPSLNILIKLMAVVSLVLAGFLDVVHKGFLSLIGG